MGNKSIKKVTRVLRCKGTAVAYTAYMWEMDVLRYVLYQIEKGKYKAVFYEKYLLSFKDENKMYLPDLVVERNDGSRFIIEIKGIFHHSDRKKIRLTLQNPDYVSKKIGGGQYDGREILQVVGPHEYYSLLTKFGKRLGFEGGCKKAWLRCDTWPQIKKSLLNKNTKCHDRRKKFRA